jgi:hypothetical protein
MPKGVQRANGSGSLALLGMWNGPGRYSLIRNCGVGTVGILPPLSGSRYRIVLYPVPCKAELFLKLNRVAPRVNASSLYMYTHI